jgi:hypothetical protein
MGDIAAATPARARGGLVDSSAPDAGAPQAAVLEHLATGVVIGLAAGFAGALLALVLAQSDPPGRGRAQGRRSPLITDVPMSSSPRRSSWWRRRQRAASWGRLAGRAAFVTYLGIRSPPGCRPGADGLRGHGRAALVNALRHPYISGSPWAPGNQAWADGPLRGRFSLLCLPGRLEVSWP